MEVSKAFFVSTFLQLVVVLLNHAVSVKSRREEAALQPALVMTCLTKTNLSSDIKEGIAEQPKLGQK